MEHLLNRLYDVDVPGRRDYMHVAILF